jgi:hypothetical protein
LSPRRGCSSEISTCCAADADRRFPRDHPARWDRYLDIERASVSYGLYAGCARPQHGTLLVRSVPSPRDGATQAPRWINNGRHFSRLSPACEISAYRYRSVGPRNASGRLGHLWERGGNRRGRYHLPGGDRAKMNKAFYDALKPGGELVVGDYSAKPGAGTSVVQTLHRSDEALVTSEIEAAGFKLIA